VQGCSLDFPVQPQATEDLTLVQRLVLLLIGSSRILPSVHLIYQTSVWLERLELVKFVARNFLYKFTVDLARSGFVIIIGRSCRLLTLDSWTYAVLYIYEIICLSDQYSFGISLIGLNCITSQALNLAVCDSGWSHRLEHLVSTYFLRRGPSRTRAHSGERVHLQEQIG
jgi:hypothetical protein